MRYSTSAGDPIVVVGIPEPTKGFGGLDNIIYTLIRSGKKFLILLLMGVHGNGQR